MELYYPDIRNILMAMLIGLLIGAEREYHSKPAGLRTMMLVSVGSCLFTMLSLKIGINNPDRLAANIITGIGFLGAGAIFKDDNQISGLTTATTIWVCAALGMCVGSGYWMLAFAGAVSVLSVLSLLVYLQQLIDNKNSRRDYNIVYQNEGLKPDDFESIFAGNKLAFSRGTQRFTSSSCSGRWRLTGSKKNHQQLVTVLLQNPLITQLDY